MRQIILIFCILVSSTGLFSQGLQFEAFNWDLGSIAEDGGEVSHRFEFRNVSDKPVVIHNIRTSCGCTTPEYSKEPIGVGSSSSIDITFDPLYQAGVVDKGVYVYSTATSEPIKLSIRGNVTPRVVSTEEYYPYTIGSGGRIEALYLSIAPVVEGEFSQTMVEYINTSKWGVEVEFRPRRDNEDLRLHYDMAVGAEESTQLVVGYFVEDRGTVEKLMRDTVDIYVNGKKSDKSLYIKGIFAK